MLTLTGYVIIITLIIEMLNLIKLWLPNSASVLLLSIELPFIAFLLQGSSMEIIHNYTLAIAYLMFSNAIIYPIAPFVIKNGNNKETLKSSFLIVIFVLLFLNLYISFSIQETSAKSVAHLFSFSLLFIGAKRYLQACLITNNYATPISQSSLIRVLFTCLLSVILLNQVYFIRYDFLVIIAILLGGIIEVLILYYSVIKKGFVIQNEKNITHINDKVNFTTYIALILLAASYLSTNLVLMQFFKNDLWIMQNWTMIFTLSSISIYPLLDIDSIFIKITKDNKKDLYAFGLLVSLITSLFSTCLLFVLSLIIKEQTVINFIYMPSTIMSFFITPFLWNIRSIMRIEYILAKKNSVTIFCIICAFILSLFCGHKLSITSPVVLFNMIIATEIVIYFLCFKLPQRLTNK